jgi:hypothetical protein
LQRRHGVRGAHRLFNAQSLAQSVNESGAEGVSRARSVADDRRAKGRRRDELIFDIGQRAARALRHRHQIAAVALVQPLQRLLLVHGPGELIRQPLRSDQTIDLRQQFIDSRISRVEVNRHRHAGFVRPSRSLHRGFGVKTVNVQNARSRDHLALQLFGGDARAVVVVPEDGSFARKLLDDDHGALGLGAHRDHHAAAIDALFLHRFDQHPAFVVVADLADVACAQSQTPRPDHRRRDLPAGHLPVIGQTDLGVEGREARDRHQMIDRVEAESDDVKLSVAGECEGEFHSAGDYE